MKRAAATGLAALVLLAGCARTTEGSVAMTTEPGPALTTRPSTSAPSTSAPSTTRTRTPRGSTVPDVPAPPGALTMTCGEYNTLDAATQQAVINAILQQEQSILSPDNIDVAKTLADAVCQFLADSTVSEVLLGGPVP